MVEPTEEGVAGAGARADRGAHPWVRRPPRASGAATSGSSSSSTTGWRPRSASSCSAAPASWRSGSACRVGAVLAGEGERRQALAPALVAHGADTVYLADDPVFADYLALPYTRLVATLVRAHEPQIVLYGATTTGRDLGPRVASTLRTGLTADCTDLRIGDHEMKGVSHQDLLYQIRPAFGGNIIATIVSPEHLPQMATVREGVMVMPEEDPSRRGEIVDVNVARVEAADGEVVVLRGDDLAVRLVRRVQQEKSVDLKGARIVVSGGVGRGLARGLRPRRAARPRPRRRRGRLARRGGRGLDRARPPGRPDRRHRPTQALHRLRHLRLRAAPRGHGPVGPHPRDQRGPRRARSSRWRTTASSATCTRSSRC